MKRIVCMMMVELLAAFAGRAEAATNWYVATNASHTYDGNAWETAFTNLATAFAIAQPGDTIHVAGQTFAQQPLYNRGFPSTHPYDSVFLWQGATNVTLIGGYQALPGQTPGTPDPDQWPTLLTRSSGYARIMAVRSASNCVIRNITFTNGYLRSPPVSATVGGVGVLIENSQDTRLEFCRLVGNQEINLSKKGGGLYVGNSTVTLTNCWVSGNLMDTYKSTTYGNGGYVDGTSRLSVKRSYVTGNYNTGDSTVGYGGGFYVASGGRLEVEETVIRANKAGMTGGTGYGSGIYNLGTLTLRNTLVVSNQSYGGSTVGGIYASAASATTRVVNCTVADNLGGIGLLAGAGLFAVTNSIVTGNSVDLSGFPQSGGVLSNVWYSCIGDGQNIATQGCLQVDPLFLDRVYYHLQSTEGCYSNGYFSGGVWTNTTANSPLIDRGDTNSVYSREPDPNGGRINMGAYGNTEVASKTPSIPPTLPAITNLGASVVGHRTATLRAQVTNTGGQAPECAFEYWQDGSGTTSTVPRGVQIGAFSAGLSGLPPGVTYRYRASAVNSAGTALTEVATFTLHGANANLYVATNGNQTASTNWVTAYSNLATAFSIAEPGDTIHVAGQTFALLPLYDRGLPSTHPYDSVFLWQGATNVTLIGGYQALPAQTPGTPDPDQWPTLLTRSSGYARIMAVRSASNCVIRNITFTNGYIQTPATSIGGVGVLVQDSQEIRLESCRLVRNYDNNNPKKGGGLYVANSTVTLTNCWVIANGLGTYKATTYGNGGYVDGTSRLTVNRSYVTGNYNDGDTTVGNGGGFYVASGGRLDIAETVLQGNKAGMSTPVGTGYGGGIRNEGTLTLRNTLIVSNRSYSGSTVGGIYASAASATTRVVNCTVADNLGGIGLLAGTGLFAVTNSIVTGNSVDLSGFPQSGGVLSNVWYSCIGDGQNAGTQGCLQVDPLFVDRVYYHEQSTAGCYSNGYFSGGVWTNAAANSPVIDKGDTNSVYSREPDPNGGRINMGAYGNTEVASKTLTISATLPAITNLGAAAVGHRTATLRAQVTDTGGETPDCSFAYWQDGSGTTNTVPKGAQIGAFSSDVSGLALGAVYRYCAYAVNSAGTTTTEVATFTLHGANANLYVATNGNQTASTNWVTAYSNLATVFAIAEPGDTIHVAGQTFSLSPLSDRGFPSGHPYDSVFLWQGGTNVTLIGGYQALPVQTPGTPDPDQWPTLLTRSSGSARIMAVRFSSNCVIRNITFTNGQYATQGGQGVRIESSQEIRLESCRIVSNQGSGGSYGTTWGGGLYVASSTVTLTNCWLTGNWFNSYFGTGYGAGGYVDGTSCLTVNRCYVTGNYYGGDSHGYGSGFYVASGGRLHIKETVIHGNTAGKSNTTGYGGGIANYGTVSLTNVLIVSNRSWTANSGDGLYSSGASATTRVVNCTVADNLGGIGLRRDGSGVFAVTNSILWGNGVDSTGGVTLAWTCYSNSTDHVDGGGNITLNPLFVDTTYYHLQSKAGHYTGGYFSGGSWSNATVTSPCVDAGDPASDRSREPSPNGGRVNMGCYGNSPVASKSLSTGTIFVFM